MRTRRSPRSHTADEYVDIPEVTAAQTFYGELVRAYLAADRSMTPTTTLWGAEAVDQQMIEYTAELEVDPVRCAAALTGAALATDEVMRRVEAGRPFRAAIGRLPRS